MLLQLSKTVKQSPKSPQIFGNNGTFCADRPFSKNRSETNCQKSFVFNQLVSELQSYILSTTTETIIPMHNHIISTRLQSYILSTTTETYRSGLSCFSAARASIVHPFNNNWNIHSTGCFFSRADASIVHPFNNNWNLYMWLCEGAQRRFNRTSFQQQLKHVVFKLFFNRRLASIVHPFNNNWNLAGVGSVKTE